MGDMSVATGNMREGLSRYLCIADCLGRKWMEIMEHVADEHYIAGPGSPGDPTRNDHRDRTFLMTVSNLPLGSLLNDFERQATKRSGRTSTHPSSSTSLRFSQSKYTSS